ncbi:MAG: anti-sigma factor antagonist [Clostridium sp.]|nr:anti-sigma factor antagonist [Clostridium sp.]MCM1399280.1 anti-sigma factor antagonist [Clostridium sp.]MCM1459768.1 anti-sigma factor antagonist [Bacteroides sp.]
METFEISNHVMIYYLPKELDHFSADRIKRKTERVFEKNDVKYLIFDFEKTTFMDSSGIGLITGRYRKVHDDGGSVFVINVCPAIDKVLTMSGIYRIVGKKDSKEEIIEELLKGGYYE